ncbi:hypothetical protein [Neofamilia massiliensis]|uniref:hypothetical protein n=1 Tax=Neofamilia massiliensis TaxID=1673724 RepID=UPI0006BB8144|nr:hypothetical protein [Neofamilia massiliensis]
MVALDALINNEGVKAFKIKGLLIEGKEMEMKDISELDATTRKTLITTLMYSYLDMDATKATLNDLKGVTVEVVANIEKDGISTTDTYTLEFK